MDAQTCSQSNPGSLATIASWTASFVAVPDVPRCAVVASTDHTLLADQDAPNTSLHTITPLRSQRCETHKVLIPIRPHSCFIGQVEAVESLVEVREGIRGVQQTNLGSVDEVCQAIVWLVQLVVIL